MRRVCGWISTKAEDTIPPWGIGIKHGLDDAIGPLEPEQQQRRVDEFKAIARYL
jgi:hypothetical protein|tara:strand:+ start:2304 stop:2465 length:162 start_codon:yes stop_codon:yes gene_type:complete